MFDESGRLLVNSISDRIMDGDGDTYVICGEDYIDFYVGGVEWARMNRITGTQVCQFSMIPTTPVPANSEWDGICIIGDSLDPAGANAVIHGIHIDFSGVSVANLPEIEAVHLEVPPGYAAIHINGRIDLNKDVSALVAGQHRTAINVVVEEAGATGGELHILDVATVGAPTAELVAIGTHTGIGVIHQHVGVFAAADRGWEYDDSGTSYTDRTASFGNVNGNVAIFDDDDDAIFIGDAAVFDEIQVILATPANVDIKPTFWYSQAAAWVQFYPADDTEGFTQSGLIRFDAASLAGFATQAVNGDTKYYIRINRTKNNVGTQPIADNIFILAPTTYYWNELGALSVLSIAVPTITAVTTFTAAGALDIGAFGFRALSLTADGLTPGQVVFAGASGLLSGDTDFTFSVDTLTVTKIAAFELTGKLTAGAVEIEGSAFDINGGTVDNISSLTASGNLDIGAHNFRALNLLADSLTSGRVIFAGANGLLSDDADFTFAVDTLTVDKIITDAAGLTVGATTPTAIQWGALGALVEWTDWTPTLTGGADLSGYTVARYYRIGDICFFEFAAENKNVTTAGFIQVTLPFTTANTGAQIPVTALVHDSAAWVGMVYSEIAPNVNFISIAKDAAANTWAGTENGVYIRARGFFEIA